MPADHRQPRARAGRAPQAQRAAVLRRDLHADDDGRHARQPRLHQHHRRDVLRPDDLHPDPRARRDQGLRRRHLRTSSASSSGRSSTRRSSRSPGDTVERRDLGPRRQHRRRGQAGPLAAEAALRLRPARRAVHAERSGAQVRAAAQAAGARADERPDPGGHLLALGQRAAAAAPADQHLRAADPARRHRHGPPEHHLLAAQPAGRPRSVARGLPGHVGQQHSSPSPASSTTSRSRRCRTIRPAPASSRRCRRRRTWCSACCSTTTTTTSARSARSTSSDTTKGIVFLNGYLERVGLCVLQPRPLRRQRRAAVAGAAARADRRHDGLRRRVLQHRRQPAAPVLEPDVRHVHRAGPAELHPERAAVDRRSDVHQPHALADPEPAEPGASRAARHDGHLQLGRLGEPAPATTASPARSS